MQLGNSRSLKALSCLYIYDPSTRTGPPGSESATSCYGDAGTWSLLGQSLSESRRVGAAGGRTVGCGPAALRRALAGTVLVGIGPLTVIIDGMTMMALAL